MDRADPKGLVRESYRIDGITPGECRSIFVDWALSLAADVALPEAIAALLARYGPGDPDHPMGQVLRDGLAPVPPAQRRGGRAGRFAAQGGAAAGQKPRN